MRSVQVSLPPPDALQPLASERTLSPSAVRVGGPLAVLEMEVAWPSLAAAAKAGRAAVWSVEAELLPSADWLLLGLHRQSFRIELWQLLALTAGTCRCLPSRYASCPTPPSRRA